eukprot:tig00000057_g105.t1
MTGGGPVRFIVVRAPSRRLIDAICMEKPAEPISFDVAVRQHGEYVKAVRQLAPDAELLELPADDAHPDSVFVEDTCTAYGGTVLLHELGALSRKGEAAAIEPALREAAARSGGALRLLRMADIDPEATCDGGDVLCTPREIFVGLSSRTNARGAAVLRSVFAPTPVVEVPVPAGLHLKSFVTAAAPDVLVFAEGATGQSMRDVMRPEERGYRAFSVPDVAACNCVAHDGAAVVMGHYPRSLEVYRALGIRLVPVVVSEFEKADGALTCMSVLL